MNDRCFACHRPLKNASPDGYGPVCRKNAKPAPTGERDLFIPEIQTSCEAALFRVELRIAVMAMQARDAVRDGFKAARKALGVTR
jgi:hypothetical protein